MKVTRRGLFKGMAGLAGMALLGKSATAIETPTLVLSNVPNGGGAILYAHGEMLRIPSSNVMVMPPLVISSLRGRLRTKPWVASKPERHPNRYWKRPEWTA